MSYPRTDPHRIGDAFRLSLTFEKNRVARTVDGLDIAATGENDAYRVTFQIERRADVGGFDLVLDETGSWPVGDLFCVVTLTKDGKPISSEEFVVPVVR